MGPLEKTAASLRFFGDDLDPAEITARLQGTPTVGVKKGGTWLTSRGSEKVAQKGSWRLTTPRRSPGDLDAQIDELFAQLTTDTTVWRDLATRFQADIFCGLFLSGGNQGTSLMPETLMAVGARGLVLNFDIYGAELGDERQQAGESAA